MVILGIVTFDLSHRFVLALNGSPASSSPLFNNLRNNPKWNITLGSVFSDSNFQTRNTLAEVNLFKVSRLICMSSLWILTCGIGYVRPVVCLGNAVFLKSELKPNRMNMDVCFLRPWRWYLKPECHVAVVCYHCWLAQIRQAAWFFFSSGVRFWGWLVTTESQGSAQLWHECITWRRFNPQTGSLSH